MLHGYPQTHKACLPVGRLLAREFKVVLLDLRGCGDSRGPAPDAAHLNYSKRAMAADVAQVMDNLGLKRYAVVGNTRGARCGHRLALDFPDRVTCLSSLTAIPSEEMWAKVDAGFAQQAFNWFLLAQLAPLPERLLAADPAFFVEWTINRMTKGRDFVEPDALAHYKACFARPEVRTAIIEDYRAAATCDRDHDHADRGRMLEKPVQVIWEASKYSTSETPLEVWRRWARNVVGTAVAAGHLMAEESPHQIAELVGAFIHQASAG